MDNHGAYSYTPDSMVEYHLEQAESSLSSPYDFQCFLQVTPVNHDIRVCHMNASGNKRGFKYAVKRYKLNVLNVPLVICYIPQNKNEKPNAPVIVIRGIIEVNLCNKYPVKADNSSDTMY